MLSTVNKTLSIRQMLQSLCGVTVNKRMSSHFTYHADDKAPIGGPTTKLNMFQAINSALDKALSDDESAIIFGEDVGFGGVFRCTLNLQVELVAGKCQEYSKPKVKKIISTEKIRQRASIQHSAV